MYFVVLATDRPARETLRARICPAHRVYAFLKDDPYMLARVWRNYRSPLAVGDWCSTGGVK
ncbi:unnamed protein product [Photorhabdus laumondii subsp. laumondii TTO1]|uniref:Photorhabdus luminescens subsp. laumondii TTO1 complete genome segment 1/17 n=1 Tax=Photorhabdus laumondii subsp. laumondii (strain DSM 15139 / CIP 105565 / TT01) TaxID=243265 RepID=Q7NA01_PHOLL|nr:unnamed protein product [Photorhabdus laumondii subsp. laumondii TTO1]